jgi:hypothetical protein
MKKLAAALLASSVLHSPAWAQGLDGVPSFAPQAFRSTKYTGNNTYSGNNTFKGLNTYTGTSQFQGSAFFGGKPWVDVKSNVGGCSPAVGDGVTDDTTSLQCHLDFAFTISGGARVYFPCGSYLVSGGGLLVKGGVLLEGETVTCSHLQVSTDSKILTFDSATCAQWGGVRNMFIVGFNNAGATQDVITIGNNCPIILEDNYVWFGRYAINTSGVDGKYINTFACGFTGCVSSNGANWYIRMKLDTPGISSGAAYTQGVFVLDPTAAENHFDQSDFSGGFTSSINISDSNNKAITVFAGSVFSSPINIGPSGWTSIVSAEIGSTTFSNTAGQVSVTASKAFSATTASGGGTRHCDTSNFNLTC